MAYPSGEDPPGEHPPGAYPPGAYPPGAYSSGKHPPGAYSPENYDQPLVAVQPQTAIVNFDFEPIQTVCPRCHRTVVTRLQYTNGCLTYSCCCILTSVGCCLLPFLCNACKDADHCCPQCGGVIYHRVRN